mmetsp:Transcript_30238/g.45638  ORF Transcript_30238/g.45638 Transcript_30238/m.45638 type:complete len:212 (+) Transcript_30238:67-702(+)
MNLLFSTILICSLLNGALADSFNFEHIGESPENSDVSTSEEVGYSIKFTNNWTQENHPFRYPTSDPHWSRFVYASHSSAYVMWQDGGRATKGIENVAEFGSIFALQGAIRGQQNAGNVLDDVVGNGIGTASQGATSIPGEHLCVDASHPYVSGISMIAPRCVIICVCFIRSVCIWHLTSIVNDFSLLLVLMNLVLIGLLAFTICHFRTSQR